MNPFAYLAPASYIGYKLGEAIEGPKRSAWERLVNH